MTYFSIKCALNEHTAEDIVLHSVLNEGLDSGKVKLGLSNEEKNEFLDELLVLLWVQAMKKGQQTFVCGIFLNKLMAMLYNLRVSVVNAVL